MNAGGGERAKGGLWVPGAVNLALGIPAMIPLSCAWWLVTEYLPMGCHSTEEAARGGIAHCDFRTLDHAGPMMFLLTASGLLMLALVLAVNVLGPLRRGDRPGRWLRTAVLIPAPYAAVLAPA
ncbi:hypothetical protein CTZ27_08775 [Streptomyces griseocarneus]|nr:hypothetical protein CTZ27_08775 [Streptomyces griseocarneus]